MFSTLNTEEFLKSNITVKESNLSLEGKKLNSSGNELVPTKVPPIHKPEVLQNTRLNAIYIYNMNMFQ
jgi:hypothetical protein